MKGKGEIELVYYFIGMRIRGIREGLGLTQEELAQNIGVGRPTIIRIENGNNRVFLHNLYKIAKGLGVSIYSLIPENEVETEKSVHELFADFLKEKFASKLDGGAQ
jgi:transcriptional regulator with XRE-family HTH domain